MSSSVGSARRWSSAMKRRPRSRPLKSPAAVSPPPAAASMAAAPGAVTSAAAATASGGSGAARQAATYSLTRRLRSRPGSEELMPGPQ